MGLVQHVDGATHRSGHTLDLIITRSSDSFLHGYPVIDTRISDHWSVLYKVQLEKPPPVYKHVQFRKIKDIDVASFEQDIKDSRLCQDPPLNDLSALVDTYNECLSDILDRHAPVCNKELPVRPRQPWFNEEIKSQRQLRRKYERLCKRTKLEIHEELLRVQKNKVNSLMHSAKCDYYSRKVNDCGKDQKATFRVVKELFHKNTQAHYPEHDSVELLVEGFSGFFLKKIELIRSKLDAVDMDLPCETPCVTSFSAFKAMSLESIKKLVMKSPTKSCSMDPISSTSQKE